jgi:hypothetical protein
MKNINLTYSQLRQILSITLSNQHIRLKLADVFMGKTELTELALIETIVNSGADLELVRILSGQDPESMDATEAMGWILAFFGYIRASWPKLKPWLGSIISVEEPKKTASKSSK